MSIRDRETGVRRRAVEVLRTACVSTLVMTMGCYQSTLIFTDPPGAKVYVNGELLGASPVELVIEDGPMVPFPTQLRARFERAGYEPLERDLPSHVGGGRIAAGIFTLGLTFALQGVRTLRPSYGYTLYPIGTMESQISDEWVRDLRELQRLRDDGLLSEEEFQRRRAILMRSTPQGTGERPAY